jgi:hypothetical protein
MTPKSNADTVLAAAIGVWVAAAEHHGVAYETQHDDDGVVRVVMRPHDHERTGEVLTAAVRLSPGNAGLRTRTVLVYVIPSWAAAMRRGSRAVKVQRSEFMEHLRQWQRRAADVDWARAQPKR